MKTRTLLSLAILTLLAVSAYISPAKAAAETYADYSLMNQRLTGQFYDVNNYLSGQWSWRSELLPNHWSISWDPNDPESREYFQLSTDGNWILLDGWSANGTYYTQRVTSEYYGDVNCKNMKAFKSDNGLQHYTLKNVATAGTCLDARGTITEQASGITFEFHHQQIWKPPQSCTNRYFKTAQRCIRQWELWEDNNGHAFHATLKRENWLAKGKGMAFHIDQYYKWDPQNGVDPQWQADGKNYKLY